MNLIVNLHKEHSITSHDAVTAVKRLFKVRKAGHAGTLDPIATGVLLVCLNEATKITGFLSDLDKEYIMTAKLGESSDTYDSEGTIMRRVESISVTGDDIESAIRKFTGDIEQIPPMHSAIKVSGRPLYELARKGIEIERKPRKVHIRSIEILGFESPFLTLKVSCSKGTYIRSLCNDIGNDLGTGAYITRLVRTRIGGFTIGDAAHIEELPHKTSALHTIDFSLRHLEEFQLGPDDYRRARHGNPVACAQKPESTGKFVRLKDPQGRTFGIGKVARDFIKIARLLKT